MRIISGSLRGKKINAPSNLPVRPTTDFAKEALFNILNNHYYFDEISLLDLFAGIGSISLEFASRGSTEITAVEKDPGCIRFLNKITEELNLQDTLRVIREDVYKYLRNLSDKKYDVIFADPPYDFETDAYLKIVDEVREKALLKEGGVLILEHPKQMILEGEYEPSESRKYGNVIFAFYYAEEDSEE